MLAELLIAALAILLISDALFGGVAEGISRLVDEHMDRQLDHPRPSGDPAKRDPVSTKHLAVLFATFGAILGLTSLLLWPSSRRGHSLVAQTAFAVALATILGSLAAAIDRWRQKPAMRALSSRRFALVWVFVLCFVLARSLGSAH